MFKIFRTIKESAIKINELDDKLKKLEEDNIKLSKVIEDRNTYVAIGIPYTENHDKRIQLLMEARNRGFFDGDNYFIPIDMGWSDTAYFKHYCSDIASNYGYNEESDSLRIPVIGTKGNFSCCRVCIYKKGKWAQLMNDDRIIEAKT